MKNKVFYYLNSVHLQDGQKTSEVEVLRTGVIQDRGLKIDMPMLRDYVQNFTDNVYGTEIQVNKEHMRGSEAMGWVKTLSIKGRKLIAEVEWTEMGIDLIEKKIFKFVSAELAMEYPHHKTGEIIKNIFIGLALTNTPALKSQKALALSEELINKLNNKIMFIKFLDSLKKRAIVSKEDKELLKSMLDELSEDEKTEEVEAGAAEVAAKPEEAEKEEPSEEEKAKEEEKKEEEEKEKEELKEKAKKALSLEEKLNESDKKIAELSETIARKDLNEIVSKKYTLSTENKIGFLEDDQNKVVDFMLSLNEDQKNNFKEIMSSIKAVDLNEIGKNGAENKTGDLEDRIVARAEVLMKEKKINIAEAQKLAQKELTK